ncbi:MAG: hypothetical protein H8D95_01515 [Candidatus Endolissoclinum sp.]|jgi:hypothetical protein|nr:hypothetical protein [Candidatus Endolissoclinum sp.]|tara:strand:- start:1744 stop:2013 length:270 start_codon:yes stop_codon:yes gene_type:complete
MNPDDLISSTNYSDVTISVDDYWNDMNDPRDEDQDAFKSINDRLSTIENRLLILVPDKEMLEKYEVLQDMYKQYKAAEVLLSGPEPETV